jgi:hypothetical protein
MIYLALTESPILTPCGHTYLAFLAANKNQYHEIFHINKKYSRLLIQFYISCCKGLVIGGEGIRIVNSTLFILISQSGAQVYIFRWSKGSCIQWLSSRH